jgi:acyl-CoA hydrolase
MEAKRCRESLSIKVSHVLPQDTNNHNTLFGGKLMSYIDDIAAISAVRHCRKPVVTASTDSIHFLHPIRQTDSVCLESYVTWTGKSSMEVFVKVIAENLLTGDRQIAATAFLTFVALDEDGKPIYVPGVIPETIEEKKLHETAPERAVERRRRRAASHQLASVMSLDKPWLKE